MKRLTARHEAEHFTIDFIADTIECDYGPGTPKEYEPCDIEVAAITFFNLGLDPEDFSPNQRLDMINLISDRDWTPE